jgi:hypothetical protein
VPVGEVREVAEDVQHDSSDYAPWNMVVLDILHLLYRGLRADELMVPEKEDEVRTHRLDCDRRPEARVSRTLEPEIAILQFCLFLLLAMSAQADSSDYAPWNMVVLDILHLLYRGLRADELMIPGRGR